MIKRLAGRPGIYPIFLLLCSGIAALFLFKTELWAETDSGERYRMFDIIGVIKILPTEDPVVINLKDMNGRNVSLSDFKGKIVFLNFWTTWCPTCRIEMPSMEN